MAFTDVLFWISIFSGGLLILLLLMSLVGGLDLDMDVDAGGDSDSSPGFGPLKSGLTIISVGAWVTKIFLAKGVSISLAVLGGLAGGLVAMVVFMLMFKFFLSQEKEVNWSVQDAVGKRASVYLKIPSEGNGLVHVNLGGTKRQLSAKSEGSLSFATGSEVLVIDKEVSDTLIVTKINS